MMDCSHRIFVTYLSGKECCLKNCITVLDAKVGLCAFNPDYLPREIMIFDAEGNELEDDRSVPEEVKALWCGEKDRSISATWRSALELFAAFGDAVGATRCAEQMLQWHLDIARMDFGAADLNIVNAYVSAGMDARSFGQKLLNSSRTGNIEIVRALLAALADPNFTDENKRTPLLLSSPYGKIDVVHALISSKADINMADENKRTPLLMSAVNGKLEVVNALLEGKADANVVGQNGITPLIASSARGNIDVVHALVASKADVNIGTNDGNTPLFVSSRSGKIEVVRALLAANADTYNKGCTPLSVSTYKGYIRPQILCSWN